MIYDKCKLRYDINTATLQKGKQKSPGRATSRNRSQLLTPGGREKVTQINMCIANKQGTISKETSSLFSNFSEGIAFDTNFDITDVQIRLVNQYNQYNRKNKWDSYSLAWVGFY